MITSYSYESLCNYQYTDKSVDNPKNNDIVFCQIENIPLFFSHCQQTSNKYVVVSVRSDFGIEEQALAHPNKDFLKRAHFVDWSKIMDEKEAYVSLDLGETANLKLCRPTDKYSIKTYAYTHATFKEVPENVVKWFACNVNVYHPKIQNVPFGLSELPPKEVIQHAVKKGKDKLLYVNFTDYTIERKLLNNYFRDNPGPNVTYRAKAIPRTEYLKEMSEHKYVLCPRGNGWDCWRIWEALYLGCIPVVERSYFSTFFNDLPVMIVDDFKTLTDTKLIKSYDMLGAKTYNLDKLKLEYWKERINEVIHRPV